eukprot:scaffold15072_cov68-Phaeocystis_antarctica.AAC.2
MAVDDLELAQLEALRGGDGSRGDGESAGEARAQHYRSDRASVSRGLLIFVATKARMQQRLEPRNPATPVLKFSPPQTTTPASFRTKQTSHSWVMSSSPHAPAPTPVPSTPPVASRSSYTEEAGGAPPALSCVSICRCRASNPALTIASGPCSSLSAPPALEPATPPPLGGSALPCSRASSRIRRICCRRSASLVLCISSGRAMAAESGNGAVTAGGGGGSGSNTDGGGGCDTRAGPLVRAPVAAAASEAVRLAARSASSHRDLSSASRCDASSVIPPSVAPAPPSYTLVVAAASAALPASDS